MRRTLHPTRREFVGFSGLIAAGLVGTADGAAARSAEAEPGGKTSAAAGPDEVLRKLLEATSAS